MLSPPPHDVGDPVLGDRLGRPLRDLRISVTDRCNFRCPYCMPAEIYGERYRFLPKQELLTFEEIVRLARVFLGLGVRKLRITGGEPLLRAELPKLIALLSALDPGLDLALTTNGALLAERARELRDAGLRRVTVSVDSLNPDTFERMSGGRGALDKVLEGIDAALRAGLAPLKINCVVQRAQNDHQVVDVARHFKGTGAIVRFIEYMDVGTLNGWDLRQVVPAREILARIDRELPLEALRPGYQGEVARRYRYRDGTGEIGMIASVTEPFCGDCSRARLSPEGQLVTCLFATRGQDLKGPLRRGASDAELRALIRRIWADRTDRYSEERLLSIEDAPDASSRPKIEMYKIGG
jgi:cyclic pyranopterin phosphate synthase